MELPIPKIVPNGGVISNETGRKASACISGNCVMPPGTGVNDDNGMEIVYEAAPAHMLNKSTGIIKLKQKRKFLFILFPANCLYKLSLCAFPFYTGP